MIAVVKQPHYKTYMRMCVTCHHIVLHPVSSRASRASPYAFGLFIILGLSAMAISDSILAQDVSLNCSKYAFPLYINLDRFDMNPLSPNISRSISDRLSLVNVSIVITASLNFPRGLISLCLAIKLLYQDFLPWPFFRQ